MPQQYVNRLLQFVAGAMVFPLAPGAITNAFAQQARNGNPIDCQSFGTKAKPEVCIDVRRAERALGVQALLLPLWLT